MGNRYYYARLSFMRKDNPNTVVYSECTVEVDFNDLPFLPFMDIMRWAMGFFKDVAQLNTIQVCNYIELSEKDYKDFNELRKSQNRKGFENSVTFKK